MVYLYHMVPGNLEGSVLYPLNRLKDIHPEIHDQHIRKYRGREQVLEFRILPLDCLWNDVLFFTALHPRAVRKVYEEIGINLRKPFRFFEIDPHRLDPSLATTWLFETSDKNAGDYCPYDPDSLEHYSALPARTVQYYREQHEKGTRPLLFYFVPHILYRGTLDISVTRIIEV